MCSKAKSKSAHLQSSNAEPLENGDNGKNGGRGGHVIKSTIVRLNTYDKQLRGYSSKGKPCCVIMCFYF